jgi:hypothetical protein
MYRALLLISAFFLTVQLHAGEILPETKKVKDAYEMLMKDASLSENQVYFIKCFPNHRDTFLRVFVPNEYDQLYGESKSYMEAFRKYGLMYPLFSMQKTINLCKGMHWSDDAVGDLHSIILEFATNHPRIFAAELKRLKKKEIAGVVYFLANAPSSAAGLEPLMDKLMEAKEENLANQISASLTEQNKKPEEEKDDKEEKSAK